jgi:sensor c-di-GMP phosphodiesterase-like protein
MPVIDGLEFIRHIGKAGFAGSVAIASAVDRTLLAGAEAMTKAYGINLLGALSKPITIASLQGLLVDDGLSQPKVRARSLTRPTFSLDEILNGLKQNQFEPFFQPKVEVATRRVVGVEALARWRHPEQGIVLPDAFVKTLEQAGQIDELTWVMLRKSIAFCRTLNAMGIASSIALNLSLESLNNIVLANRIAEITEQLKLEPSQVCL